MHDELAGIEAYGSRAGEAIQAHDKALSTLVGLQNAAVSREDAARVLVEQQGELRLAQYAQEAAAAPPQRPHRTSPTWTTRLRSRS